MLAVVSALCLVVGSHIACAPGGGGDGGGSSGDGAGDGGNGSGGDGNGSQPQDTTITGTVVDASDTEQPIADAYVYVPIGTRAVARQDTQAETHTDESGSYTLSGAFDGTVTLVIEPPQGSGYASVEIEIDAPAGSTIHVRVTVVPSDMDSRVSAVTVTPPAATVARGASTAFSATVEDADGALLPLAPTWTVSANVGTVDEDGLFTAGETDGTGTIRATVGGVSGTATVVVAEETPFALADTGWPMYMHDAQHTGRSPYVGPQIASRVWQYDIANPTGCPVLSTDGSALMASNQYLYSITPAGALGWRQGYTGVVGNMAAAVASDGTSTRIYAPSYADAKFYALNANGTQVWSFDTSRTGLGSPCVGPDGTVYFLADVSYIHALNQDGTVKWSYSAGNTTSMGGPALAPDGTVYFVSVDGVLHALTKSGGQKWSYDLGPFELGGGQSVGSPSVGPDGTVYVGSDDKSLHAIDSAGQFQWAYATGGRVSSTCAIGEDGAVYVASSDGYLSALDSTGTQLWQYKIGGGLWSEWRPAVNSPALGADGTVYFPGWDGSLHAIGSDGVAKWTDAGDGTGFWVGSPAIGPDGALYAAKSTGVLYCYRDE